MGTATNFFSSQSVLLPVETATVSRALVFKVGDGSSTTFTISRSQIQYVLDIYVLNDSDVQQEGWTVAYGEDTIAITLPTPPAVNAWTIIVHYLPDTETNVSVVAS